MLFPRSASVPWHPPHLASPRWTSQDPDADVLELAPHAGVAKSDATAVDHAHDVFTAEWNAQTPSSLNVAPGQGCVGLHRPHPRLIRSIETTLLHKTKHPCLIKTLQLWTRMWAPTRSLRFLLLWRPRG